MFFACFLLFFYKSEKHVFYVFYLQINVFNIYAMPHSRNQLEEGVNRMRVNNRVHNGLQCRPRSLILAPIESAYATSYWSSIVIFPRFRAIAGFLLRTTPPLFHPNFRGVPLGLDYRRCGSEERRTKLIIPVINFELFQPICPRYINGRTNRRTTYDSSTGLALRASRGNKTFTKHFAKMC